MSPGLYAVMESPSSGVIHSGQVKSAGRERGHPREARRTTLRHPWQKASDSCDDETPHHSWNRTPTERNLSLDRAGFSARRTRFCQLPVKALLRDRDARSAARLWRPKTPRRQSPLDWASNDRNAFLSRDGRGEGPLQAALIMAGVQRVSSRSGISPPYSRRYTCPFVWRRFLPN